MSKAPNQSGHPPVTNEDDFWGGPTARQTLESNRKAERRRFATDWRRNVLTGAAFVVVLSVLWFALR